MFRAVEDGPLVPQKYYDRRKYALGLRNVISKPRWLDQDDKSGRKYTRSTENSFIRPVDYKYLFDALES